MIKSSLVHHLDVPLPPKKMNKTMDFPAAFEPAPIIDLTEDGFSESFILKPRTKAPLIDLNIDETPESLISVPKKTVAFADLSINSPNSKKKPLQHNNSQSTRAFISELFWKPPASWFEPSGFLPAPYSVQSQELLSVPYYPSRAHPQKSSLIVQLPVPKPPKPHAVTEGMSLPPPTLQRLGLSFDQWKKLEDTSHRTLPRFLFRGFHPSSGGGIDPRLNSPDGIIPHAFLNLHPPTNFPLLPTNIYDIPDLHDVIRKHLGDRHACTPFSSWAANFMTAKSYTANGNSNGSDCYIAILDTDRLESHVRAYHVPALARAGLTGARYDEEYLVYGPVRGEGFHSVPCDALGGAARTLWGSGLHGKGKDLEDRVRVAKNAAALFRSPHDTRPDIVIAMTVVLLCTQNTYPEPALLDELARQLSRELRVLQLPAKGTGQVGLVNPCTFHDGFPSVHLMMRLLVIALWVRI
ncbi:hypothetical protein F5X96DRAFT_690882 [Biscogniauxia mediterranea]|nr:hypothetical protein F5X96DRAFT_690882 [Biscogniauxia mediterranea]